MMPNSFPIDSAFRLRNVKSIRGLATSALDPSHLPNQHPMALMGSFLLPVLGATLAASSIAFAPPYEFDDLDCQSYCQQFSASGVCDCDRRRRRS